MTFQLREYQQDAVDTALNYLYDRHVGNQVVAMPTGSGKASTQAAVINELVKEYPNLPIICPTHVKEIVEQNVKAIKTINPQLDVGIYSAGLKIKQTNHQIIFGGIASMINHLPEFGERVLCVVDEAHRMSPKDDTSYFKFFNHFKKMGARLIGFSATPYRMGNGLLTDTELFDDITVDYCTRKWWQYFIAHNYLVPPIPKPTKTEFDLSKVGTVAGEFNQQDADLAINVGKLNYQAAIEILQYGAQRNHVLVACSSVDHAIKMSELFDKFGETSGFICSSPKLQSSVKNDQNIEDFTKGKIKYLCVYGQCVIGFDFPALDMIAVLRATKSVAFWVQLIGRGTRPFAEKTNCLVLDFCRNAMRLGPIDEPRVPQPKTKGIVQEVPLKSCPAPDCGCYNHISARVCDMCGWEFQFKTIQEEKAGTTKLIGVEPPLIRLCNITRVFYDNHVSKKDGRNLIKASYYHNEKDTKYNFFTEYFDFEGKMRFKAKEFWLKRVGDNVPSTNEEALNRLKQGVATNPKQLKVWINKQPYPEIMEVVL